MKAAVFEASAEFLTELLQLPDGAYIDAVEPAFDCPGVLRFRLCGIGHELKIGDRLPSASAAISVVTLEDGRRLMPQIRWSVR